jgi:hypothetical protein
MFDFSLLFFAFASLYCSCFFLFATPGDWTAFYLMFDFHFYSSLRFTAPVLLFIASLEDPRSSAYQRAEVLVAPEVECGYSSHILHLGRPGFGRSTWLSFLWIILLLPLC